jgi:aminodeoxyfutalosine deaminase
MPEDHRCLSNENVQRIVLLSRNLASFLQSLPKAELHLHLEGSIEPATAVELAARHGIRLTPQEVVARYAPGDFRQFLEAFKWITSLLRDPDDYGLVTRHLAERLVQQNVVYAEVTLSAGVMLRRQQDPLANLQAICDAASSWRQRGLRLNWIFDAVRQFGGDAALAVARLAAQTPRDSVVAFGMGGDELGLATHELIPAFAFAKKAGLAPLVHAGEIGPAQLIREAIEQLAVVRIGHGIAAMHDEALMDLLTTRGIPLELCLTSNLRTGALACQLGKPALPGRSGSCAMPAAKLEAIAGHPLRLFVERGVPVTLSTDDPAMFQTSLNAEYLLAAQASLSAPQLLRLIEASFEHALLPSGEKQHYIDRLRAAAGQTSTERD